MRILKMVLLMMGIFLLGSGLYGEGPDEWLSQLPRLRNYRTRRAGSWDRTGANRDYRSIEPGATLTLAELDGPAMISHIWSTISSAEKYHLKKLVLRIYWDGEAQPSVEAPIGDFYGLGNGEYFLYESGPLAVGATKALNSYFPMPFNRSAKLTVTNEGEQKVRAFYFNIDYQSYPEPFGSEIGYFHAQYRQCAPCDGWTWDWTGNSSPKVGGKTNPDGKGNYLILDAKGRGHYVGVTHSVFQNQDDWWGEGDEMIFLDGEKTPSIIGTGSEDYYLGAWGFGDSPAAYQLFGVPVKGEHVVRARWSVYRFHLEAPIPFERDIRVTMEHGHANHRSDNFYTVAYWYQIEPHAPFSPLPNVKDRLPRLYPTGGAGRTNPK